MFPAGSWQAELPLLSALPVPPGVLTFTVHCGASVDFEQSTGAPGGTGSTLSANATALVLPTSAMTTQKAKQTRRAVSTCQLPLCRRPSLSMIHRPGAAQLRSLAADRP